MKNTLDKLREAEFFYKQFTSDLVNFPHFRYNLSAFISSARSVTFVMQKELKHKANFEKWYKSKQKVLKKDKLFQLMNSKRKLTIHIKPIKLTKEVQVTYKDHLSVNDNVTIFAIHSDRTVKIRQTNSKTKSKKTNSLSKVKHVWFFDDFQEKDVISLCSQYLTSLQKLIKECQEML